MFFRLCLSHRRVACLTGRPDWQGVLIGSGGRQFVHAEMLLKPALNRTA